jgi:hypothetical protein
MFSKIIKLLTLHAHPRSAEPATSIIIIRRTFTSKQTHQAIFHCNKATVNSAKTSDDRRRSDLPPY